jgi:D-inositol-3-phosphate glycosyltransferase
VEGFRALVERVRQPRPRTGYYDVPRGDINVPASGAVVEGDVVQVLGWCLFPGSTVARVEVTVGAAQPQRARLGMPRPDVATECTHPSAPVCGFEYMAHVPPGGSEVTVTARAWSADGRELELEPVTFAARAPAPFAEHSRAYALRSRASRFTRVVHDETPDDDSLRVLVFTHQLPYGGASLYLLEVLRRFARKPGFECSVVTLQDGPLRTHLEALGIPVHVTDPCPVTSLGRYESSVAALLAWAAPQRFDVALVNTLFAFQGADVAERLGIPVVWAVHESFDLPLFWATAYPPGTLDPYVPTRMEEALEDAGAIVFEAEATRQLFVPHSDPERLITMPYGIELKSIEAARSDRRRADARRALGLRDDARVLLCLGTVEPRKGQATLVEAFASIAERHPDTVLALVGETDADWCAQYTQGVHEFVARNGLEQRVRVVPVMSDPYPWHLASDLHVCASDIESLPRSVLEAMAFGVPVVSTRVYGVPEVVEDGVSGYLCDTRDASSLAAALDRALSAAPEELERIRACAAQAVARRHEPGRYADLLWKLITAHAGAPADALTRASLG